MSTQEQDEEAAAADAAAIAAKYEFTGDRITAVATGTFAKDYEVPMVGGPLSVLSICILVLRDGSTVVGWSAPDQGEDFNLMLGRKAAFDDAMGRMRARRMQEAST